MATHRTRVGVHARNSVFFTEPDYELIRRVRIETIKMMSLTDVSVYERLRRENPGIEFIVRLYDDRIRRDSRPSPADFVAKMVPIIVRLQPYATKFEIHNEPNHAEGVEGWGASDDNARSFRDWYMQVLSALKEACPWAQFGFPGLAPNSPHRDLEWLTICRDAIRASDWLGCHCYWQDGNMLKDEWGLRFKLYHERFPRKTIEITEFGDSTPNRSRDEIARLYVQYYTELNRYPYLGSASAFIASSPDPAWVNFVWMKEGGEMLPVVHAVTNMERKPVEIAPPVPVPPPPPAERTFPETGKTVRGSFLNFFDQYGLDICGYPITDQIEEAGLPSQYFQRVGLEEKEGKVRLKLVGSEAWASRARIAELQARIEQLSQQPPAAGGVVQPTIQDLVDALPKHASARYPTRSPADINQIVIHHTATGPTITPQRIAEYQVRTLNKPGITYHFFITADGVIYQTNRLETVSDHAFSRNQGSVGVCFAGNFTSSIPTAAQLKAGGQLCAWLLSRLCLTPDKIVGLGEFVNTQSPGLQWLKGQRWKDRLLEEVKAAGQVPGEDQSLLVASLRKQIEALKAEIEQLKQQPPPPPAPAPPAPVQEVLDDLTTLVTSLQAQVKVLQQENDKLVTAIKQGSKEQAALITALQAQVSALQKEKEDLLARLEEALKKEGSDQSALIASLRAQIKSLQEEREALKQEIERLKKALPVPPPTPQPPPVPGKVSKPAIQDLVEALPKHATLKYDPRPLSDIQTLVIHHSAVAPTVGPKRIAEYHVNSLNWPGIGYHFLVGEDGIIYQGNCLETVSYHAAKVNPRGVGICFLGNFQKQVPPPAQLRAGAHLIAWLLQELKLDLEVVKGHQEYMQTACPGEQWLKGEKWKQMLRREIANVQAGAVQPVPPTPVARPIYHYMLFWHHGDRWAVQDFVSAQNYIGTFQPTVGFSAKDAAQAEYVTIVGGPLGVSKEVENWLIANGSRVDRIAGKDEADTKKKLDDLVKQGRRFQSFNE